MVAWFKNFVVAHRGLHDDPEVDENSHEAFALAVQNGYAIECDVRLSADGVVVVHHDETTLRMCDVNKRVEEQTLQELKKLKMKKSSVGVMTLEELLTCVAGQVPLLIEIKFSKNKGRQLDQEVCRCLESYKGEYAVQSFDPFTLIWFKNNAPNIKRGFLSDKDYKGHVAFLYGLSLKYMLLIPWMKPHFLSVQWQRGKETFIKVLCKVSGLPLVAWTVGSKHAFLELGTNFDTIIFENKSYLEEFYLNNARRESQKNSHY